MSRYEQLRAEYAALVAQAKLYSNRQPLMGDVTRCLLTGVLLATAVLALGAELLAR